jgi:hypothetical protein
MEDVKGWLKQAEQFTNVSAAGTKVIELEKELKDVAIGLHEAVKESSVKVDALLASLRSSAAVIGLQSLVTTRCTICYDNQLDCYLDPCGHTMCNTCASKLDGQCFVCKEHFNAIRPLYFS